VINRVNLCGRLTGDPETKHTTRNTVYVKFRVAVDYRYQQGGEWKSKTDFVPCVAWGREAEYLAQTGVKGAWVVLEGRINVGSYQAQGQTRQTFEVHSERLQVITHQGGAGKASSQEYPSDDDIPF
jgi:single-strand DNA-binding protein